MKRNILFLLAMICITNTIDGMCSNSCNICSHTTFVPRMLSQNSVLELGLHNYYNYHLPDCDDCCAPWVSVEVTAPYYFKSTKPEELARYFLPQCKECVTIGQNNRSDISSLWLEIAAPIATPFESTVCIRPTRSVIGGALRLFFDLSRWSGDYACYNFWASIFIPAEQVRQTLHITEIPGANSSTPIVPPSMPDALAALNNPNWLYGKLAPHTLKKAGVDDICIKFGSDFLKDDTNHFGIYGQVFAPTGQGTHAEYLFEPLVGGNHVGVGPGINADYRVYESDSSSLDLMIDLRYAYFFKSKEHRSIDLFNGDWSRYLLVVSPTDPTTPLPGINFFTQEVQVTPGSMLELWAAFEYTVCNWHLEVGYDFWYRSKEKIKLCDQDLGVGILDIAFNPNIQCPTTAHCAKICAAVPTLPDAPASDSPDFITVKSSEEISKGGAHSSAVNCLGAHCSTVCSYLNLNSAANPRATSSTVYGAVSYDCCWCAYPVMIGVGGQYEFAHRRSALSQYGVWLKTAVSF